MPRARRPDSESGRGADFPTYVAQKIDVPLIDGSLLNVECRVVGRQTLGQTLFSGGAVWARFDPEKRPL